MCPQIHRSSQSTQLGRVRIDLAKELDVPGSAVSVIKLPYDEHSCLQKPIAMTLNLKQVQECYIVTLAQD